jgi:SAM-dependent MidA family methyltransferase
MTEPMTPLDVEIRRRIDAAGPMPVGQYMALCLTDPQHGYYVTRDPLGARGDFTTAPEVSQMFGELVGLWIVAVWHQMGKPDNVRIVELGPGRGTMMKDALRAAKVMPGFLDAAVLHLVEINPVLQAIQEQTLAGSHVPSFWHKTLNEVPRGPAIVVANEFFDALPIDQVIKMTDGWHRRTIGIGDEGNLKYVIDDAPLPRFETTLPASLHGAEDGEIFEWRSDMETMDLGRRLARDPGVALIVDYGHGESSTGDTLQAVRDHVFADPLAAAGEADLTAHVDFEAMSRTLEAMGTQVYGPLAQAAFLSRLGIDSRAAKLKGAGSREQAHQIDAAMARLTGFGRTGMGSLFKVIACTNPSLPVPPAFES